tara:strand:+ start:1465 stop:1638 length:174 start_codon:yes stop_codon:yes gene_type:complete
MQTITFIYKDKVEQFKEQFPILYQEIYNIGYQDGCYSMEQYLHNTENPEEFDEAISE